MTSPLDNLQFTPVSQQQNQQDCPVIPGMSEEMCDAMTMARQNPQAFEQQVAQRNPRGYQEALQIRNGSNPREAVRRLCQQRGVPPHIMKMFGL